MRNAMRTTGIAQRRSQGGYILIAAMLGLAILASIIAVVMRLESRRILTASAEIEGQATGQFAIGLRGFIAAAQSSPAILPGTARIGVNWLKPPTCGGLASNPAEGYVPCSFTGATLGPSYSTTFTRNATTNAIEARTTFVVRPYEADPTTVILMAERIARGALSNQSLPNNGVFFNIFANVAQNATSPAPAASMPAPPNRGRVVLVVNNAPSNDIFLRTDGTNRMLANLNFGGFSVQNARDGQFTGNVRVNRRMQVDQGLTSLGAADLRGGVVTNEIALTSVGKFVSEGIYDARILTGATAYNVTKPNCTQAGNNPGIYVALQGTGTMNSNGNYNADSLFEARADVANMGSYWRIVPRASGVKFGLTTSGTDLVLTKQYSQIQPRDQRLLVMTRCR